MITLLIALASCAGYLAIGWRLALRNLPYAWRQAREWYSGDYARTVVRRQTAALFLAWPFLFTAVAVVYVRGVFNRAVDAADPKRDLCTAELERKR